MGTVITFMTPYDETKRRNACGYLGADGDVTDRTQIKPGDLILCNAIDKTVYVVNYKLEKQPITYNGYMKYYKAPGDNPWAGIINVSPEVMNSFPKGEIINENSEPAILVAPKVNYLKKYWWIGAVALAGIIVLKKFKKS